MSRNAREISAILRAAGKVEEARTLLEHIHDHHWHRETLKAIADDLAATAVADKVKIANDLMQNHGRES